MLSDKHLNVNYTRKGHPKSVNNYPSVFLPFFPLSFLSVQIDSPPLLPRALGFKQAMPIQVPKSPVPPFPEKSSRMYKQHNDI